MNQHANGLIVVTGATGHIGNVLVRKLLRRGAQVRVLMLRGEDSAHLRGLPLELPPRSRWPPWRRLSPISPSSTSPWSARTGRENPL